ARAIAREAGAPIVMTAHTDYAYFIFGRFRESPVLKKLFTLWGNHYYRPAKAVIVPSEKAGTFPQLVSTAERLMVIPSGIQLDRYQKQVSPEERAALLRQCGLDDTGFTLVMVTRVSREKNIMEILRFFPELLRAIPKAQLIIAGEGPERRHVEAFVKKNGLEGHVCMTGRIDPDEVYRYYALGDVFVSASTFETQGLTYLEAMACGLPLVCREDPVLRDVLVNGENGFTYRTEEEFVEGIVHIAGNRQLWQEMHKKAIRKSKGFGVKPFVERTVSLYEQVLG
ncbi:MAG: glycosyltransferase, partial [Acidaminococcaceae bacterium]|nr:glycosyltransferase [Acidaminococcaceae bacterium]